MTAAWVTQQVAGVTGTLAEKFAALHAALGEIEVQVTAAAPRCDCGTELSWFRASRTGRWALTHPRVRCLPCPRERHQAWADTQEEAARLYVATAPALPETLTDEVAFAENEDEFFEP